MGYNLRDLKFFETVAEYGHVGRAAEVLGRSQPAITKSIHRLEAEVGEELLVRDARGVHLTPTGSLLLERARSLLHLAGQVEQEVRDFSRGGSGLVRIGSGLSTAAHVLPGICARLLADTGVRFELILGTNIGMRKELRDGRIDLLVGLLPPDGDLQTMQIMEDQVAPAVRHSHPLAAMPQPDVTELLRHPWALPTREIPSRQWWDRRLEVLGLGPPDIHIQSNSPALLLGVAERADLVVFTSHRLLPRALLALPTPELTMDRAFGVTIRRDSYLSPAARRTVELLVAGGADLFGMTPEAASLYGA